MELGEEIVTLTGNPFVDTGLAVIAALAGQDDIEALTMNHIRQVHADGSRLSSWNHALKKTFMMVFTTNSLLTNPSIKDQSKRISIYRTIVNGFLNRIGHEELPFPCEACGYPRTLDLDRLCRTSLADVGATEQARFVGRDWFPWREAWAATRRHFLPHLVLYTCALSVFLQSTTSR